MPTKCQLCEEAPASVFRPTIALCRSCHRSIQRMEIEDNEVPNSEACGTCATLLNASGTCGECVVRAVTEAHRAMVRHG